MGIFNRENKNEVSFRNTLLKVGIPIVTFKIDRIKLNFILDTGATTSLINSSSLDKIKKKDKVNDKYDVVTGLDPNIEYRAEKYIIPIRLKNKQFSVEFCSMSLNATFNDIQQETGIAVDGLLGSDFFEKNKCTLDYNKMTMIFNNE